MGSVATWFPKGTSTKEAVEELTGISFLDSAAIGGVFYGVFVNTDGKKMAFVGPYSRSSSGGNRRWTSKVYLTVKLQDETMGPYDARCPDRLLDLLDEAENDYAACWRGECREANAKERELHKRAKNVGADTTITLATPVEFGRGIGFLDTFRYSGKGSRFTVVGGRYDGLTVNLTNWRRLPYSIANYLEVAKESLG